MTEGQASLFTVLLKHPDQFEVGTISQILAPIRKEPALDIAPVLKRRPGVLAAGLNRDSAEHVIQALAAHGFESLLVEENSIPTLTKPKVASTLLFQENSLKIQLRHGEEISAHWNDISVLAVAALGLISSKKVVEKEGPSASSKAIKAGILLTTGIPLPSRKPRKVEKTITSSEFNFFADLFFSLSQNRIRLISDRLSYGFLSKEKGASSLENFRAALKQISARTSHLLFNPTAIAWLSNQPITKYIRDNEAEFEEECRWLTALKC